ncbi:MAG: hypothetical protein KUL88_15310 [Rhizobium sp.]|nr:hypothetical protein [Rhizobium sp.]
MAILAAVMTAIAAAEFVLLIVMAGNRSDPDRVAELQAALTYVAEHVDYFDRLVFIRAYLGGYSALLEQKFPSWRAYRNEKVALARETDG